MVNESKENSVNATVESEKMIPPVRICIICASDMVYNPEDGLWHCSNPDCWWVDAD